MLSVLLQITYCQLDLESYGLFMTMSTILAASSPSLVNIHGYLALASYARRGLDATDYFLHPMN
jgi:hypothetical protein